MREKTSGVYEIVNTINGNRYIGSSKDIYIRWRGHKKRLKNRTHINPHLQNAWLKYGEDQFNFKVLETCQPISCVRIEQKYLDALKPEYNISPKAGGGSFPGCHKGRIVTEEWRKKISETLTGRKLSPEQRMRISLGQTGKHKKPMSAEGRAHISEAQIGKKHTDEHKKNISLGHIGKVLTSETKEKISKANTGRVHSAETRMKISENRKGKGCGPRPKELMEKLADSNRGKHISIEQRKILSDAHKGIPLSDAHKAGMRAAGARKKKSAEDLCMR